MDNKINNSGLNMLDKEFEEKKQQQLIEKLNYFLRGDQWAIKLCVDLIFIAHLWDDLIDNDYRNKKDINEAFRIALVEIPGNPFYFQHIGEFKTLFLNVILQWQDANAIEEKPVQDNDLNMAYMLRASVLQIFNYCAYLIGGPDWAIEVGPDLRRLYEENFETYKKEIEQCLIQ